ncbi:hypothetical protein T484DRAFT_1885975, partial [Baffinella frigidus]
MGSARKKSRSGGGRSSGTHEVTDLAHGILVQSALLEGIVAIARTLEAAEVLEAARASDALSRDTAGWCLKFLFEGAGMFLQARRQAAFLQYAEEVTRGPLSRVRASGRDAFVRSEAGPSTSGTQEDAPASGTLDGPASEQKNGPASGQENGAVSGVKDGPASGQKNGPALGQEGLEALAEEYARDFELAHGDSLASVLQAFRAALRQQGFSL